MSFPLQKISKGMTHWVKSLPNLWSPAQIQIVTDGYDWVIHEVSHSIAQSLEQAGVAQAKVSPYVHFSSAKVLHFNSVAVPKKFSRNKVLMTWYHVNADDPRLQNMQEVAGRIDLLHTTAQTTKEILVAHGFPQEKIRVLPMGIDLRLFSPGSPTSRAQTRASLGIPPQAFVVGSFQKDGDGWGTGMHPKWMKGPDVFCDVLERLAKEVPVHVLLSGPSRGYVKDRLSRAGVPFTHKFLDAYKEVNTLYQALDAYLISSRVEGVPMALLEAWATGTPIVSTRVGMVKDVAMDGQTALLAQIEDRDKLTEHLMQIYDNRALRDQLISQGLAQAKCHGWDVLIKKYWEELYLPLL
ncbi:MAG: glycosyltransferase family 4 protein [Candidatus Uhrbacteria bacterium]|nr:glycosyltransferase family 4 protein [Candidatus Uhrbacteria bacterium]